ncbi:MAG TPA: hypothetical protein VGL72_25135 [Bryobacteraceae bacterium]
MNGDLMMNRFLIATTLLFHAPILCAAPSIAAQGVKNAASFADPRLPNGSIAQGSIFNVFGSGMGPATIAYASSLPLPTTLSGTSINVTVGGTTVPCVMFYTSASQVAAILPSNTPAGTGTITVSYNGSASPTAPITVVKSSFGVFTVNQQGSGTAVILDGNNNVSSSTSAFQPGETVVAWGTGLGPISGNDASTPPTGNLPGVTVAVTVGGATAPVIYAGRSGYAGEDQIDFTIPSGVSGCNVPVAISVTNGSSTVVSNYVTMAVGATTTCTSATSYPPGFQQVLGTGTVRVGSVLLNRSVTTTTIPSFTGGTPTVINSTADQVEAGFDILSAANYTSAGFDLPYGACAILNTQVVTGTTPKGLDAGSSINVSGPNGAKQINQSTAAVGSFYSIIGGGTPLPGQTAQPLYFSPGSYSVNNGSGGKDVAGFSFNVTVPQNPFTWTNYSSITSVNRSQALTVNWTGGDPSWDVFLIGTSSVAATAGVTFECRAHDTDQTLTVPVSILQALPASATTSGIPLGSLTMSAQAPVVQFGTTSGLDLFTYGYSVEYQNGSVPFQ